MARLWASAALLPLALLAQILVFYPAAVTAQDREYMLDRAEFSTRIRFVIPT